MLVTRGFDALPSCGKAGSSMKDSLVLYSYFRSSASYRVRIALNLKQLSYEYKPIHLINGGGEQYSEEYRRLNPSAELPTLVHNGRAIGQSVAIIQYLDDVFFQHPLIPQDPYLKAKTLQVCEVVNSGIQPLQNLRVLKKLEQDFSATEEQKNRWIQHWIRLGFESLEKILEPHAGPFAFGARPSMADAFLMPQIYNAHRFQVDMTPFPTLNQIAKSCGDLDAFQRAHPDDQPDTP